MRMNATRVGDPVRVVIANHDPVFRRGLRSFIEEYDVGRVVAEVRTQREALEAAVRLRPDVVLLGMPSALNDGLKVLPVVTRICKVLVFTDRQDAVLSAQAVRRGVAACMVRGEFGVNELLRAVSGRGSRLKAAARPRPVHATSSAGNVPSDSVLGPRSQLSRRQAEVMDHMAEGADNTEIARRLVLSEKTVKNHINHIFAKLGVRNRAEAIVLWLRSNSAVSVELGPALHSVSA